MDRSSKGKKIFEAMFGAARPDGRAATAEFRTITNDYLFGEIWSRPGLELRDRSIVTVSILVATGKEVQLKAHLRGAVANGLSPAELKELIIHAAHYSGWPNGVNGLTVLQEVIEEEGLAM